MPGKMNLLADRLGMALELPTPEAGLREEGGMQTFFPDSHSRTFRLIRWTRMSWLDVDEETQRFSSFSSPSAS